MSGGWPTESANKHIKAGDFIRNTHATDWRGSGGGTGLRGPRGICQSPDTSEVESSVVVVGVERQHSPKSAGRRPVITEHHVHVGQASENIGIVGVGQVEPF